MKHSIKMVFKSIMLLSMVLILNALLFGGLNKASAMTATEGKLATLIERYGETNVIVENGLYINEGQEKTLTNGDSGQAISWISTDDKIVKVLSNNTIKGISSGTTFLVGANNGKYHILEVYVDNDTKVNRSLNTISRSTNNVKSGGSYKVFIDAGHGGTDPGAVANGVREADINLSIALKVERKLKEKNVEVMMSRTTNVFVELKERARLANEYGAHVFVSIHQNAAGSSAARGIETYYHETKPQHRTFATKIQTELIKNTGANNRGVLTQDFLVNRETTMPSALVECGYITNGSEAAMLTTDAYQEKVANGIVEGVYNYLKENVQLYKWVQENDNWYYVNEITGEKKTGWILDNNRWYFANQEGVRQTGWLQINGYKYYLDENGVMKTEWLFLDNNWYFFNPGGDMKTGWAYLGTSWFYFNKDGVMATGFITDSNRKYYLAPSGAMQIGLIKVNDKSYYFDIYGQMKTGWVSIKGTWYYFDNNGEMKTGWVNYLGTWYYMDNTTGAMKTGWITDGGRKYYLDAYGVMKTGWLFQNGTWYYLDIYGAMQTGWSTIGGANYYFYSDGRMAANTVVDGKIIDIYGRAK